MFINALSDDHMYQLRTVKCISFKLEKVHKCESFLHIIFKNRLVMLKIF